MSQLNLRLLSLDGGGIKGLTSLLILKRLMRTVQRECQLAADPRPCEIFDLIGGTSTGGISAIMLGRLGMSVDECIAKYKLVGSSVFGKKPFGSKYLKSVVGKAAYSAKALNEIVIQTLADKKLPANEPMVGTHEPGCKVFVAVTRTASAEYELLRNYLTTATDQQDYPCYIWETCQATSAAPIFFEPLTLHDSKVVNEAGRMWPDRHLGCVVSIGTGWTDATKVPARLDRFLGACVELLTKSEHVAESFLKDRLGKELYDSSSYFRFNVEQGLQDVELDDWEEEERMDALATAYLGRTETATSIERCAKSLKNPNHSIKVLRNVKFPVNQPAQCQPFIDREGYTQKLHEFFNLSRAPKKVFVIHGIGGSGKSQTSLNFALTGIKASTTFWVRADTKINFLTDYSKILDHFQNVSDSQSRSNPDRFEKAKRRLEESDLDWFLVFDNADDIKLFRQRDSDGICLADYIPAVGHTLITTRDRRFAGEYSAISHSFQMKIMDPQQAERLFLDSIPQDLQNWNDDADYENLKVFLRQLGYLPLAIAQAAANIREFWYPVSKYIGMYQEKKKHADLLENPVRNPGAIEKSVLLTWEISLNLIKEVDEHAIEILNLLGLFHWSGILPSIAHSLWPVKNLDDHTFQKALSLLVNLNLVDQVNGSGLQIHPMIHEWIISRLTQDMLKDYSSELLHTMTGVFSMLPMGNQGEQLSAYFIPHALHLSSLLKDTGPQRSLYAIFLKEVGRAVSNLGFYNLGVELGAQSVEVALQDPDTSNLGLLSIRKRFAETLQDAGKTKEAEAVRRTIITQFDNIMSRDERPDTLNTLCDAISMEEMIAVNSHNLAHILWEQGKISEAEPLVKASITWLEKTGKQGNLRNNFLNLQAHLLRSQGKIDEALQIYRNVLQESCESHGKYAPDSLIAANHVVDTLLELQSWEELKEFALPYLQQTPDRLIEGVALVKLTRLLSRLSMSLSATGDYEAARTLTELLLPQFLEFQKDSVPDATQDEVDLMYFSIAVCFALDGKWKEAYEFREQHLEEVRRKETSLNSTLEEMEQSENDRKLIKENPNKMREGGGVAGS
ncbi:hypothetical protein F5882DRAFT_525888 [Hyaloscypha sp. PMI_1271]|nr:hypothetical protein F5882DRAFT_525888 [Hyaloscypha sp. PMI_1271]